MKSLFILGALALSSAANAQVNQECWDGSFGYNYARVVETSRGIEVSLTGSSIKLPPLYSTWNQSLLISNQFNSIKPSIHVILPNKPTVKGDTTTWSDDVKVVQENADSFPQAQYPVLWLKHYQRNLGAWQSLVSDIEVQGLSVDVSPNGVTINFTQHYAPGTPKPQKISVGCGHSGVPENVALPAELVNHLDSVKK